MACFYIYTRDMSDRDRGSRMTNQEEMDNVDKIQQDILDMRQDIKNIKSDVNKLQLNDIKQDEKIINLQTLLSSIQDDTKWIRRMITKAIVTAVITGLIGGAIALFFAKF